MLVLRLAPLAAACAAVLAAQQQTPQAGSITGTVRDLGTGAPIAGAQVAAQGRTAVTTDTQGRYTLRDVPPGPATVGTLDYKSGGMARTVIVAAGQETAAVNFRVFAPGRISGIVTDEDDKPLAGVPVHLVAREYSFGAANYVFASKAQTNSDGEYTLSGVPAGRAFRLMARAAKREVKPVSDVPADPTLRTPALTTAYFPAASSVETAGTITLFPGEVRERVNIRMARKPGWCVSGAAGPADSRLHFEIGEAQPVSEFYASVLEVLLGWKSEFLSRTAEPFVTGDTENGGKFRVCGLPSGSYRLRIFSTPARSAFGSASFRIADGDVEAETVALRRPAAMTAEAAWDGDPPPGNLPLAIGAIYSELRSQTPPLPLRGPIPGPLSFRAPPLQDDYAVNVLEVPAGAYVKDIVFGGRSVRNRAFRPADAGEPLRIILARDGGRISVAVADSEGKPVADADVVAIPENAALEADIAFDFFLGRTDASGAFTSGLLAPGRYHVLSGYLPVDRSVETIDKYWRLRGSGGSIEVTPRATVNVSLAPSRLD